MNFALWQSHYAEHAIATIPCDQSKRPLVKNPEKFGRSASAEIAAKFSAASAFGYYAGTRNGISVPDVDTTDEKVLATALGRHGASPIIVRTGSGKFHALYRHNGERRSIRAWDGLPIDLLGAGLCIAPPSVVTKGRYEIVEGHLDDLDRLPIMREIEDRLYNQRHIGPRPQKLKQGEGRNNDLFNRALVEARNVDDYEQLLDWMETRNQEYLEPMQPAEVTTIANNAWKIQIEGRNRKGLFGSWSPVDEVRSFIGKPDDFYLLSFLRAENHPDSTFMITNGLAEKFGWHRKRLAAARKRLVEQGYFRIMRQAGEGHPMLFRWANPAQFRTPSPERRNRERRVS
jgi:hypothetical protein